MDDFLEKLNNDFEGNTKPNEYSPLVLAYMGDCIFDLFVRTMIIKEGNCPVNNLHKKSKNFVSATAQATMYNRLLEITTEEEQAVLKRGRNAKSFTKAKNATVLDYRYATGLEALFGYLYLKSDTDRLIELFKYCTDEESKIEK